MRAAKPAPSPSPSPSPCDTEREEDASSPRSVSVRDWAQEEASLSPHPAEAWDEGQHWKRVCGADDIPRLGARVVRREIAPDIAIFRTAEDRFFALADRCPHRGGPLSQGIVFGERVACPLHNTCVELDGGCAVAPDSGEVQTFGVKVRDGHVYLDFGDD